MSYNPTFASEISNIAEFDVIYADSVNVFAAPSSGVIATVNNATYISTKPITFGADVRFEIPVVATTSFQSLSSDINIYTSNLSGTIPFISGDIARLNIADASFFSGTGTGKMFDLTSDTAPLFAFNHRNSLISGFSVIGTLNGGNYLSENIGWVNNDAGITLTDMNVIQMAEQGFILQSGNHITINGTLGFGNFDKVAATPSTGDAVFNIDSATVIANKIVIRDNLFSDSAGGTLFAAGSKDQTDIRVICKNNGNAPDSKWIGEIGFEGNSTDTSLSKDTPADISGTFTSGILERHTRSGGEVTYTGLEDITENITVSVSIKNGTGGGKRNIQVHLLLDTGSGFAIIATHNASMSAESISLSFTKAVDLSTSDKYKAQVENIENNDDMLVKDITIVGAKV